MHWVAWALIINLVISAGYAVYYVGRERPARSPLELILCLVEIGLMIWGIAYLASNSTL